VSLSRPTPISDSLPHLGGPTSQEIASRSKNIAETMPSLDTSGVLTTLKTSPRGLGTAEAARRRELEGPNSLPPSRGRSAVREFADQLTNMFAAVLIVSAALTFSTYLLTSPRNVANLELTFGILGVVMLNALIGFAQEHAAERTAEALQAMVPHSAKVLRAGQLTEIQAADLVPGDVVVLEEGDAVSADCRVIEAHNLSIEMATLTGESQPVGRTTEQVAVGKDVVEARNCAFMGTSVTEGTGKAVVFATGLRN
jgi:Ca2+-transporting ATPase